MPTYAYRCKKCEHEFEIVQRISEESLTECPECKGEICRLLFPVGIVFKGSGFHINDYPSSGSRSTTTEKKDETTKPSDKETASAAKS
ncbi:MAG: zinc ribbon domain-containing protein [Armatimonadetes bacterium]|nr:zinc ribbon domain-containing protein [Armatimonadota bacterium]